MKTLPTHKFLRQFAAVKCSPVMVVGRGKVVGTWTPAPKQLPPLNVEKRLAEDFPKGPLPFTFAELLKKGKKR